MNILKRIFSKKETAVNSYQEFWNWFGQHERNFYHAIKKRQDIERDFIDKLSPQLEALGDGFYFLTGMCDDHTVELILTPDGVVKNIVFVEELVADAPAIPGWKFTALKPPGNMEDIQINMGGYVFDSRNLFFYANEYHDYPDEIDITLVYQDYKEEDRSTITNGAIIFIDNCLGELNAVTLIDNLRVTGANADQKELIPITKLQAYLLWREKEFIEKYKGKRHNTENDSYTSLEAQLEDGKPLIAIVNTTLLEWDSKASHPWILKIEIHYEGDEDGMPDNETYELMNAFEEEIMSQLKDFEGYLNIGRETANNSREVYFACKDFRKPSKTLREQSDAYAGRLTISYDIFKDKYWQSFERFQMKQ